MGWLHPGCTQGGCPAWGVRDAVGYRDRCAVHARVPPADFDQWPADQRRRVIARAIADPADGYPRADEEASLFVESENRRRATQGQALAPTAPGSLVNAAGGLADQYRAERSTEAGEGTPDDEWVSRKVAAEYAEVMKRVREAQERGYVPHDK